MIYFFRIIFSIVLLRTSYSTIQLLFSVYWLQKNSFTSIPQNNDIKFFILIPVLREQKILENTVNNFLNLDYDKNKIRLFLISTEKELFESTDNSSFNYTTIDLIERIQDEVNKKYDKELIKHIHYPDINGKMVHQLNYAFEKIFEEEDNIDLEKTFFAIYNADSNPNSNTLSIVSSLAQNSKKRVFQQSALFLSNFEFLEKSGFLTEKFLKTNSILHSRWTLAHEIPRLLRQSLFLNRYRKRIFLSHSVGHGLFLRADMLKEIKKIPDSTMTEDLFLGYVLSLLGESINPLPVLENAETPSRFWSSMKQKYVWFFGPLDHFQYDKRFKHEYKGKASYILRKWLTFQGIIPAIAWILMGWMFIFILIYPAVIGNYTFLLYSIIIFILYGPLSYLLVLHYAKKIGFVFPTKGDYLWIAIFSLPVVFLHSIPPLYTIFSKMKQKLTGKEPVKTKTER